MQKCAARENCELFESRNKQKREVQKCAARENCETAEKSQNCGNFRKNCAGAMDLPMRNIFRRLKKYRAPLGAAFVLLVLSTVCSVALPTLMTNIVDYGINEKDLGYVYRTCAIMAGVAVAYAGLGGGRIQNRPGRRGGILRGTSRGNLREGKFFAYGRIRKDRNGAR